MHNVVVPLPRSRQHLEGSAEVVQPRAISADQQNINSMSEPLQFLHLMKHERPRAGPRFLRVHGRNDKNPQTTRGRTLPVPLQIPFPLTQVSVHCFLASRSPFPSFVNPQLPPSSI